MENTNKTNTLGMILFFMLVPVSATVLAWAKLQTTSGVKLQNQVGAEHAGIFWGTTLGMAFVMTIVAFGISYLIGRLVLKISAERSNQSLFVALVLAFTTVAVIQLMMQAFGTNIPVLAAVIKVIVLAYAYYVNSQDRKGTIALGITATVLNVLPEILTLMLLGSEAMTALN